MKKSFEFLSDLIDLAKDRKIKLVKSSVSDRPCRYKQGTYDYIEVSFLCPMDDEVSRKEARDR